MRCSVVLLLGSCVALAQSQFEAFETNFQAQQEAWAAGRYEVAVAKRAELRKFVESAPVDAQRFSDWVQRVAGAGYDNTGMHQEARTIVEHALARVGKSGSAYTRMELLTFLAAYWREDRNLLKSAAYFEESAIAARDAGVSPVAIYSQLVTMYRDLGRPDAAESVIAKMQAMGGQSDFALSYVYQNEGRTDEAIAVLKKLADQPAGALFPSVSALQRIAALLVSKQQYTEAASTLREAINRVENTQSGDFANSIRQQLAVVLAKGGQTEAADQVFQQVRTARPDSDPTESAVADANYYIQTERKAQADQLLQNYLKSHSDLSPDQEASVLFTLASTAGDDERAREYQNRAAEKQRIALKASGEDESPVTKNLELAVAAVDSNPEQAFSLAMMMINTARSQPAARMEVLPAVSEIAERLAGREAVNEAEQLFQEMLSMAQSWSADSLQPLLDVTQAYAQFRVSLGDHAAEALDAIERYRNVLIASRGAETGWMVDILKFQIEVEGDRGDFGRSVILAQDLLAFEESIGGKGSQGYKEAQELLKRCVASATVVQLQNR